MASVREANPIVVILTALPVEYAAVRRHLTDIREEVHPERTVYERGIFSSGTAKLDVAIVEVGAGNTRSAVEGERALQHYRPTVALFVGVAGGLKDVQIGDVVAASRVYGYESGKANDEFALRADVTRSSYGLEQRARAEGKKSDWLQRRAIAGAATPPRVFVGPIAAGEKVVASVRSQTFRFLRENYGDALAVEMEGRGFLESVHASESVMGLVIRGISDLEALTNPAWYDICARNLRGSEVPKTRR